MTSSFTAEVRPAVLNEAQAIADLHVSATTAAYQGLVPDEHLNTMPGPKRLGMWRDAIEYGDPQVQVALDGAKIVGFPWRTSRSSARSSGRTSRCRVRRTT